MVIYVIKHTVEVPFHIFFFYDYCIIPKVLRYLKLFDMTHKEGETSLRTLMKCDISADIFHILVHQKYCVPRESKMQIQLVVGGMRIDALSIKIEPRHENSNDVVCAIS